jgi:hypothetical protein
MVPFTLQQKIQCCYWLAEFKFPITVQCTSIDIILNLVGLFMFHNKPLVCILIKNKVIQFLYWLLSFQTLGIVICLQEMRKPNKTSVTHLVSKLKSELRNFKQEVLTILKEQL